MKKVVIVQARTGSTRLPGKILLDLAGRPMLARQLDRLKLCREIAEIVVATTDRPGDDAVAALAESEGVPAFRGSEEDVLGRYLGAARRFGADIIVRVTADCPLIDPEQTDRVAAALGTGAPAPDYASNVIERTFPRGLDAEAISMEALERSAREASSPAAREHVTHYILVEKPALFSRASITDSEDNSDLRWTVDTPEDLELVRRIYKELGLAERHLPYREILRHVRASAELQRMNAHIPQKKT